MHPTTNKLLLLALVLSWVGCTKKEPVSPDIPLTIRIEHFAGEESLGMDTVEYMNAAGNVLTVSRLTYYISGWEFIDERDEVFVWDAIHLIDVDYREDFLFQGPTLPAGTYRLRCKVGIGPEHNHHDSLENTIRNNEMIWPTMMGGGYHFMKFEGHFLNDKGASVGFTMHLGNDGFTSDQDLSQPFLVGMQNPGIVLRMDVLEWFMSPYIYDLNAGNYSMGDSLLMKQLATNGKNAITILP